MKISVRIKPGSRQEKVVKDPLDGYLVWVREPAKEGKANEAAVRVLAEHFGVAKSCVRIISGNLSRNKVFEILL